METDYMEIDRETKEMKIGFDNEKYLQTQSSHIRERISEFGGKLYLNSAESFLTITTPPGCFPALSQTASCGCSFR